MCADAMNGSLIAYVEEVNYKH